jgi:hypothetical protein
MIIYIDSVTQQVEDNLYLLEKNKNNNDFSFFFNMKSKYINCP